MAAAAAIVDIVTKYFLAILTHVAQMPPTKFWLNLIYH